MSGRSKTSPCIYCEVNDSVFQYHTTDVYQNSYEVRTCNNCESFFINPRPSEAILAKAYDAAYYGHQNNKFNAWIERPLDYYRSKRAKFITKFMKTPAKILDIGCGNGDFLYNVQQQGDYQTYGIEMPGSAAKRAQKVPKLHLKIGALEEGDFEVDHFDAITLFHVFEHLTAPSQTLDIIDKILKKDGILAISFPNIKSWQSQLFKGDWLHLDPPRHLFFMDPKTFKKEMSERGYDCLEEKYFSPDYNPFGYSQSILNKVTRKRDVLYESLKGQSVYTEGYSSISLWVQKVFFVSTSPLFIMIDLVESFFKKSATVVFVLKKRD